jgi:Ca-activated chloride channel family protein
MTHINPDDPKWTAYIFDELDAADRDAVERELEASEEARMLVEELRFAADLTKMELRQAVTITPLTPQQRESIRESVRVREPRRWFGARPSIWAVGFATAAVATVALAVLVRLPSAQRLDKRTSATAPIEVAQAPQPELPLQLPPAPATAEPVKPDSEFKLRYEHPAISQVSPTQTAEPQIARSDAKKELLIEPPKDAPPMGTPQPLPVPAPPIAVPEIRIAATTRVFGSVQDATASYIPGVTITATNQQTGTAETTVTNETGAYSFEGLQPGNYKLTGELPGFQTGVYNGIRVAANAQAKQDMTLQVAAAAETVEVTAKLDQLNASMSSARGAAQGLRQQALSALPLSSRDEPRRAPGAPRAFDRNRADVVNRGEAYDAINDNPFLTVAQNPLSTFSIDVDTASYSNVRRFLNQNQSPPRDAVRIEEMINYFTYDYPQPSGNAPVGASIEAAAAPWNPQHRLVKIGIKARDIEARRRPPSNLVFLLDVSGSMQPAERLPLLKDAMRMLVEQLTADDRVTVVTYAGTTGVALRPTRGDQKDQILRLIDSLEAGGSTNGGSGIQLAYEQATANFIRGGVNRVILATDGDFNVGITDRNALLRLIEQRAKSGVFLTVLGVGMGNYKDATLEMLADKGNGNFAYLDTLNEARKVLVDQMNGTLVTMAKDVKVQVEFNPAVVDAYRLIGYENRALRNEDFNNDLKDSGDMGAGHTVTVLYEVVPRGVAINAPGAGVDLLKYQQPAPPPPRSASNETLTVKIRYKEPSGNDSQLLSFPLVDREQTFERASADLRFAAAVASFGMILRDSPYKGTATIGSVLNIAEDSLGADRSGYRREFLQLVQRARQTRGR